MPIKCEFIDPSVPALPAAADYLFKHFTVGDTLDLSQTVVAVPGGRAGRRLEEVLVDLADSKRLVLIPPEIRTVGSLPELFYRPQRPFAGELVQQLAWAKALASADRTALAEVVGNPPAADDISGWRELGALLRRTHLELAADGLDFEHVVQAIEAAGEAAESRRWQILRAVQKDYLARLDELDLWDRQTARLVAIRERECRTQRQVVLVGTVDINRALRQMLDQVADRVTALIPATSAWADRFDQHGCLVPDKWADVEIELPDRRILLADDPADQANTIVRCIAEHASRYRADEITIGVPDERIVPQIERLLEQHGLPARWWLGHSIAETGPYRLLAAIGRYVADGRLEDFAALVRHPDLFAWIQRQGVSGDWLTQLDQYAANHLPSEIGRQWLGPESGHQQIKQVYGLVEQLVGPLRGKQRPLGEWTQPLLDVLCAVYGDSEFDRLDHAQRTVLTACNKISAVLTAHCADVLQLLTPAVSAALAIGFALDRVGMETIPAPTDEAAIELLGWLELPLDDAPAMIVTSLNEGFVPKAVNSDLLLPDGLRNRLGLEDNLRRYARDAYALNVILAGREDVQLIVARRDGDRNPLAPSRLLFAADTETIARRGLEFFDEPARPPPGPPAGTPVTARETPDFPYLLPQPLKEPINSLSPTGFRDYLACPYRFYLRHVARLQAPADDARELDGGAFGTLLHEVLGQFGEGEYRDATDADIIRRELSRLLDRLAGRLFGKRCLAAVSIQVEQARLRLAAFAERQAQWAQQYRIVHTERYVADKEVALQVDGRPFFLRGRIDRIDVHRETGATLVLDYKSSDTASTPEKAHRRGGQWVDLQLPIYRHLVNAVGIQGPVRLGYVQLPRDVSKVGFCLADWSEDELKGADEVAATVVRNLRDEVFWPPADPPPAYSEEFAWLCHDGMFDKPPFPDAGRGGSAP